MRKGWEIKRLGDVCLVIAGQSPEGKYYNSKGSGLPFYQGKKEFTEKFIGEPTTWSSVITKEASKDDILMSVRAPVGPVNFSTQKICIGRGLAAIRAGKLIDKDFLFNFLLKHQNEIVGNEGAVFNSINKTQIENIEIPLPTIPEQKRIVSILDKVFAAIDKAKSNTEKNLQNAKELFESYLQNVFENPGKDWEEIRMEELCDLITCGVAATPKYVEESLGVPFLSAQNVRNGEVVLDNYRYISKKFHQELTKKNKPAKGDVLYSRVGSKFGEAGVVEHDFEFSVYVSLTLIKPKSEKLNKYYLKYYLNSPIIKSLAKKSISSSGVPNLNVKDVREFVLKCPSISIQKKIVNEIENLSTETKKLETIYQQKLNDLEELKKSILQKAFAGELTTAKELTV